MTALEILHEYECKCWSSFGVIELYCNIHAFESAKFKKMFLIALVYFSTFFFVHHNGRIQCISFQNMFSIYSRTSQKRFNFQNMPSKSHLWSIVFGQYRNLKYFVVGQVQVSSNFPVTSTCTPNQIWKQKKSMLKPWICFLWIVREWNSEVNFILNLKFILLFMEESNEYFLWRRTIIISFKTRRTWMYVTGSNKNIFQRNFWTDKI